MKIDKSWYIKPKDSNFQTQKLAGGIVVRKEGEKLLIAFVGHGDFSTYILPKGRIEKGEPALIAAKREICEETGINHLTFLKKLAIKKRLTFKKDSWNTYHYYLFLTDQTSGIQKLEPEEKGFFLEWFDIYNPPPIFWPEQKELIEENKERIKSFFQR